MTSVADPLTVLPPELVLHTLEFAPISALASLTATSKDWHQFIDVTHQETVYSSESKTIQPPGGSRDLSSLLNTAGFSKTFDGTSSWKDLCRRQTLLARNWAESRPTTREAVYQIGDDPVWRFRPDFKRRFFISTSHAGGLNVTDMDTGQILWRLPSSLDSDNEHAVRPYAHLEYQDGMAVFDREGNAVEVWQADVDDAPRGEFRRIAILNHDCQTRGFQLSYWTLCVVSNEGQGFVYDMTPRPPKLITHVHFDHGAVGHLDQSEDVVIYSMGSQGYNAYDKRSGAFIGTLRPERCTDKYHIRPPAASAPSLTASLTGAARHDPGRQLRAPPRMDRLIPIEVVKGPLPSPSDPEHIYHGEDEWGAGMMHGNLFVGFSRAGRVFVCSNWRKAVQDDASLISNSYLLECESDGSRFDLGGWLSVQNHRIMFEIQDRIYVVALDDNNRVEVDDPGRASYSLRTSSAPQLTVPISFMTLCDDAILTTYTAIGWRQNPPGEAQQLRNHARMLPVKAIRVVSLAPDVSESTSAGDDIEPDPTAASDQDPSASNVLRSQAGLLQLISMLGYEIRAAEDDEDEDGLDGEDLGVILADDGDGDGAGDGEDDDSEEEHTPAEA